MTVGRRNTGYNENLFKLKLTQDQRELEIAQMYRNRCRQLEIINEQLRKENAALRKKNEIFMKKI